KVQLKKVKKSQSQLAGLNLAVRNKILTDLASLIKKNQQQILKANEVDLKNLKRLEMKDRLVLNEKRLASMANGLLSLAKIADPLNKVLEEKHLPNGLHLKKVS